MFKLKAWSIGLRQEPHILGKAKCQGAGLHARGAAGGVRSSGMERFTGRMAVNSSLFENKNHCGNGFILP